MLTALFTNTIYFGKYSGISDKLFLNNARQTGFEWVISVISYQLSVISLFSYQLSVPLAEPRGLK
uniref:hypothetical protein n=1 Tax=Okeania sp. SIO2F4 TaxID=2607790 RepID=UPI0025D80189|nr:hypothetical protein [Okeania sp. SIO2F4]